MARSTWAAPIVLLSTLATFPGHAAETPPAMQLAAICAACHSPVGASGPIHSLVGREETALADALAAFKAGTRDGPAMRIVASSLSDAEISTLAHYFAAAAKGRPR